MEPIAGHGPLLRASLSAPMSIPSIISDDHKALYEESSHPGNPYGESGWPSRFPWFQVSLKEVTAIFPPLPCSEDQHCRAGKDHELHLSQTFCPGQDARRRSDQPRSPGMWLDLGEGSMCSIWKVYLGLSLGFSTDKLSVLTGPQFPRLENGNNNNKII